MAVSSIVLRSALENFLDWSSEYYQPSYMSLAKIVRKWPIVKVRTVAYVTDGEHGSPDWDDSSGIRYVTAEHIKPNEIADLPMRTISRRQDLRNTRCHLQEGDVLVYSVGAYAGFAACAEPHLFPASIPRSVAIIRIRDKESLKPEFLSVFLNSKYGLFQSYRFRAGNSQPVLALEKIRQYEIPLLPVKFQSRIRELYDNAYKARRDAQMLYIQAQKLLESELELDKLRFGKIVSYAARYSITGLADTFDAGRIDAQCFAPEVVYYEGWLLQHTKYDHLSSVLSSTAKGRQQVEVEGGTTNYCSIKHISSHEIIGTSKANPASGTPSAMKNDILLAITGATIGKIGIVNRYDELVFSGDLLRLRTNNNISPYYLLLVLDHHLGQVQFNRWVTGSTNGHLAPRDVGRVLVPRLSPGSEEQISALVAKSLEKQLESEQLLEQARSRVEQLIEEGVK
jgi:type I restriction enzyme S subunit